jgi:two-component system, chemotaxis family, sensor kinase CheA
MSLHSNDDQDFLRDALPAFISESVELLDQLEQLLLELEDRPTDRELLDALFRCAHTIKGSAGLFGLVEIVAFTHHVETFLDALREGKTHLTGKTSAVLLQSGDQIRRLVTMVDPGRRDTDATPDIADQRDTLIEALVAALPASGLQSPSTHRAGDAVAAATVAPAGAHRIALHYKTDTFRDGFDPLGILDYLGTLGTIESVSLGADRLPAFDAFNPEDCHLDLSLVLRGSSTTAEVEAAFEMVREDCEISVSAIADPGAADAPDLPAAPAPDTQPDMSDSPAPTGAASATTPATASATTPATLDKRAAGERRQGDDARYVRVRADRLDDVINLLGELVIAGAGTGLLAQKIGDSELIESSHQLGRLIEEIRNGTLQMRMVQIGETFGRFRRVVHDLAAELGKQVHLEIAGAETELDKSVVERITDPLMHLVRNAMDHGIETCEQRLAAGKPATGTLRIAASHDAGGILISISDDGRGIDRERVLHRARERGLVSPGITPSDGDLLALIFEPGFSTAEQVTNLSGRGVGMDVVRRNVESLRGRIDLSSTQGKGTTIEVRLPLTLAIIDGFLVSVGSSKFIFPLDAVVEVIENRPTATAVDAHGCSVVELRGQVLPVMSLRALYGIESLEPERSSVVVIQSGGRRYGVMVDGLLGQHQTVIKPLGRMFRSLRGMSGSSILGNGEVALIFDVTSLCQLAEHPPPPHTAPPVKPMSNALNPKQGATQ